MIVYTCPKCGGKDLQFSVMTTYPQLEHFNVTECSSCGWREEIKEDDKKTGHWTLDETDNSVTCDNCGCTIYPNDIINGEPHFCTNCGLKMKG